jgi:hypothetical protein
MFLLLAKVVKNDALLAIFIKNLWAPTNYLGKAVSFLRAAHILAPNKTHCLMGAYVMVIRVLFNDYMCQQHFRVADFLPSHDRLKAGERNGEEFGGPGGPGGDDDDGGDDDGGGDGGGDDGGDDGGGDDDGDELVQQKAQRPVHSSVLISGISEQRAH